MSIDNITYTNFITPSVPHAPFAATAVYAHNGVHTPASFNFGDWLQNTPEGRQFDTIAKFLEAVQMLEHEEDASIASIAVLTELKCRMDYLLAKYNTKKDNSMSISIPIDPNAKTQPVTSEELAEICILDKALHELGFTLNCESYPKENGFGEYYGPDLIKDKFCWVDIMVNRPGFRHDVPLAPPSVLRTGAHAMLYGIDKQGKYTWFTVHHLAHQSLADWVKNLQYS